MLRHSPISSPLSALLMASLAVTPSAGCKKKPKDAPAAKADNAADMAAMDMAPTPRRDAPRRDTTRPSGARKAVARRAPTMGRPVMKPTAPPAMRPNALGALDALGPAARPSGKAYVVKLDRPLAVGTRYRLVSKGHRKTRLTADGKVIPQQTKTISWIYEAEVTVKAVDAKGRATREVHKVITFSVDAGGKPQVGAPKGATILASVAGGKETFAINGKPASGPVAKILDAAISLANRPGKPTGDEIFGPGKPVQVGARWPIHGALMLADLQKGPFAKSPLKPTLANVKGQVALLAKKVIAGISALVIRATVRIDHVAPAMGPVKPTKGYVTIEVQGYAPVDTKALGGGRTLRMRMYVEGELRRGGKTTKLVMRFEQQTTETQTPMK